MIFKDDFDTLFRPHTQDSRERRANNFAMRFLMPAELIAIEAKRLTESDDFEEIDLEEVIKRMANRFRVPYEAMKNRLIELDYLDRE